MRVGLVAALACAVSLARAEVYTLLHRATGSGAEAAWSARAFVTLGTGSVPVYESIAEWLAAPSGGAAYQLMLVPGDVHKQSSAQLHALEAANPIAYTAEVRAR